jgi:hypothetical protein
MTLYEIRHIPPCPTLQRLPHGANCREKKVNREMENIPLPGAFEYTPDRSLGPVQSGVYYHTPRDPPPFAVQTVFETHEEIQRTKHPRRNLAQKNYRRKFTHKKIQRTNFSRKQEKTIRTHKNISPQNSCRPFARPSPARQPGPRLARPWVASPGALVHRQAG